MKIAIDMDDVIVGTNLLKSISTFLNKKITYSEIKTYYMQEILGNSKKDFFNTYDVKTFYDDCKIFNGCFETLQLLNQKHDIYICSAFVIPDLVSKSGELLKLKYDFLLKNLPFISPDKFIFTSSKEVVDCDVKIDDRLDNLKNAKIKLLFTAYHNKNLSSEYLKANNIIRVNNWLEIKKILED